MLISQLINSATHWLDENGYTGATKRANYTHFWTGFARSKPDDAEFSESALVDYIVEKYGRNILNDNFSTLTSRDYRIYRAFSSLIKFYLEGKISGTSMSGASVRQKLPDYEEKTLKSFMDYITEYTAKSKRYSYSVIHHHLRRCPISQVTDQKLLDYFYSLSTLARATIKSQLGVLRRFYVFCYEQKILDVDYTHLFPSSKTKRNIEIPSVFTPSEIRQVLNYLRDYNENRKRNYAIALLAAIYGFRAGDISSMKLADINWEEGVIVIIQAKTKQRIEHRLLTEVGNALVEYIFEERPTSDQSIIFLKENGQPLNATSISSMVFNGFLRSGVDLKGRKHGTHSLRHSLASNMIAGKANVLDVSKALGHTSLESVKVYAKIDISHLRLCELEVPTDGE